MTFKRLGDLNPPSVRTTSTTVHRCGSRGWRPAPALPVLVLVQPVRSGRHQKAPGRGAARRHAALRGAGHRIALISNLPVPRRVLEQIEMVHGDSIAL